MFPKEGRKGTFRPCSRTQRRRARTTSVRFFSAEYRVFEADVAPSEEPPHRAAAASNGEVLPRFGFAATLPVSSKRCTQITTTLGLSP